MSPLPDDEVRRRMAAVAARMSARAHRRPVPGETAGVEIDVTPMPKPASDAAAPPTPWQDREPGEDREP